MHVYLCLQINNHVCCCVFYMCIGYWYFWPYAASKIRTRKAFYSSRGHLSKDWADTYWGTVDVLFVCLWHVNGLLGSLLFLCTLILIHSSFPFLLNVFVLTLLYLLSPPPLSPVSTSSRCCVGVWGKWSGFNSLKSHHRWWSWSAVAVWRGQKCISTMLKKTPTSQSQLWAWTVWVPGL